MIVSGTPVSPICILFVIFTWRLNNHKLLRTPSSQLLDESHESYCSYSLFPSNIVRFIYLFFIVVKFALTRITLIEFLMSRIYNNRRLFSITRLSKYSGLGWLITHFDDLNRFISAIWIDSVLCTWIRSVDWLILFLYGRTSLYASYSSSSINGNMLTYF